MQTSKKNSASIEQPDYLIRNRHLLLNTNGNSFYYRNDQNFKALSSIKEKPTRNISPELKFGVSTDFPILPSLNTLVNHSQTKSLYTSKTQERSRVHIDRFTGKSFTITPTTNYCTRLLDASCPKERKAMQGFKSDQKLMTRHSLSNKKLSLKSTLSTNISGNDQLKTYDYDTMNSNNSFYKIPATKQNRAKYRDVERDVLDYYSQVKTMRHGYALKLQKSIRDDASDGVMSTLRSNYY